MSKKQRILSKMYADKRHEEKIQKKRQKDYEKFIADNENKEKHFNNVDKAMRKNRYDHTLF